MSRSLAHRVAYRYSTQQDERDEPHDPSNGVLDKGQLDSLQDKHAWRGYQFSVAQQIWNDAASFEEGNEPDDWGDGDTGRVQWKGPLLTLDEVLEEIAKTPFKWSAWITKGYSFDSKPKKLKKTVVQGQGHIERIDGKSLSDEEREHITYTLRLKT
jgi:hypothetical protein